MPTYAGGEDRVYPKAPEGTHQAVCFGVWDIGKHKRTWKGKESLVHQIIIGWELVTERHEEGKFEGQRFMVFKSYSNSLGEKSALSRDLVSWRGTPLRDEERKKFDLEVMIGKNCILTIVHNENYANVGGGSPLMKGIHPDKPENALTPPPEWVTRKALEGGVPIPGHQEEDDGMDAKSPAQDDANWIPF